MFNFLKEKLGNWMKKLKPEEEKPVKAGAKKEKKKKTEKAEKKKRKSKEEIKEEREIGQKVWKDIEKEQETKEIQEEVKEEKGFFSFFKKKLTDEKFEELFQELETILLQNNVAVEVVEEIKRSLKQDLIGKNLSDVNIKNVLEKSIFNILMDSPDFTDEIKKTLAVKSPFVILFAGINGSGKTTTIAKIANLLKKEKYSCVLAAADTFRAASIEQLEKHAEKLQIPLIKKEYNSDPASVGFDAIQYAKNHHINIVLIDTAGRMNTKENLMKEMEKISRVCKPDMKIFVGESITGNDAIEQAKAFNDAINLNGIILSKADVDERGGTAISVEFVTKKPIYFIGTGQSYSDIKIFKKQDIIKSLF